jgi:hypothetical protein
MAAPLGENLAKTVTKIKIAGNQRRDLGAEINHDRGAAKDIPLDRFKRRSVGCGVTDRALMKA